MGTLIAYNLKEFNVTERYLFSIYDRFSTVFKWRLILQCLGLDKVSTQKNSTFSGYLPCEMRLNRADQTSEYVMLFISRYEFLN